MTRLLARGVAAVLLCTAAMVVCAPGAGAHSSVGSGVSASNYRVTVTDPIDVPGVSLDVGEAGTVLVLTNTTDHAVTVLGYDGEPYLRVGPDGVEENLDSPARYLNRSADRPGVAPLGVGEGPPEWRQVSDGRTVSWHDHRSHWMVEDPPEVRDDPTSRHLISEWEVPIEIDGEIVTAAGVIAWVPPSPAWPWLLATAVLAVAAAAVLMRFTSVGLWGAASATGLIYAVHLVGVWFDSIEPAGEKISMLTFPALAVAMLVGAARMLEESEQLAAALALASAVISGVVIASGTWTWLLRSQVPSALVSDAARVVVVALSGVTAGVALWAVGALLAPAIGRWRAATGPSDSTPAY